MSIFRKTTLTNPGLSPLSLWHREMNQLIDRFSRDIGSPNLGPHEFIPCIEVKNTTTQYVIRVEVPGMDEKDIKVSLVDHHLIIEGEKRSERSAEGNHGFSSEIRYGTYYRMIPLEDEVNSESIKASYENGVLCVELAKAKPTVHQQKVIPITRPVPEAGITDE